MRPRYLLDLLKHARGRALTLRHEKITDDDIDQAVSFFSTDVVQDTNLELRDVFPAHDGILYAFIGAKSLLSYDDARLCLMLFRVEERSEEHTSELQSLMRISYAVFCLKKKQNLITHTTT